MAKSDSVASQVFPLIRRRFFPLWLAAVWPYALLAGSMTSIAFAVHPRLASGQMGSSADLWNSMSSLNKLAMMLAFTIQIFLPRDLGAVGVAMIVRSHRLGADLELKSLVSRYARIVWLVVPLSIGMGIMTGLGCLLLLLPGLFFALWSAFVMPALATAQDNLGTAMRRSFRFSLRQFGPLLGLLMATIIAEILALLGFFVPNVMAAGGPTWWVGLLVGWFLFSVLMGLIQMTRSVVLALLYLEGVRSEEAPR
jgi:hypothetical protein